jgi:hypothetical protein
MTGTDGTNYLMIVYEGVENAGSATSLISEFQMRHNGVVVDSTSTRHIGVYGNPGTQSITFPTEEVVIPLYAHSALMTCLVRELTDDEFESLPRLILTSTELWDPKAHYEDDDIIVPLNSPIANALLDKSILMFPIFLIPEGVRLLRNPSVFRIPERHRTLQLPEGTKLKSLITMRLLRNPSVF